MNGNQNRNKKGDGITTRAPQDRAPGNAPTREQMLERSHSRFRKRKREGINPGIVIFALVLIAVIAVSVFVLASGKGKEGGAKLPEPSAPVETEVPEEADDLIEVPSSDVGVGRLILVNYQYPYDFPEEDGSGIANVYDNGGDLLKVSSLADSLDSAVLDKLLSFASDFEKKTGDRFFMVNSAYRTYGDQVSIYQSYVETLGEDYARLYVASPGCSEHHTGMAFDLAVVFDDGSSVPIDEYRNYGVMRDMIGSYGFILRYPENKSAVTKIGNEPWHFRYVGVPHASLMEKTGLCLEEYVGFLKNYTADGSALYLASDGTVRSLPFVDSSIVRDCILIYYVPVSDEDTTTVPVPKNAAGYSISGNNVDGFIVTVTVGQAPAGVLSVDGAVEETARNSVLTGEE